MSTKKRRIQVDLSGKFGLFLGPRNDRSLTTVCMEEARRAGMTVGILCKKIDSDIEAIAKRCGCDGEAVAECNVLNDWEYEPAMLQVINALGGQIDTLFHGIAFAPNRVLENPLQARLGRKEKMEGSEIEITKMGDLDIMMKISATSLFTAASIAKKYLRPGSSVITLSYGSDRYVPGYNGMGMAKRALEGAVSELAYLLAETSTVNAISAGPIRTTAAEGIPNLDRLIEDTIVNSPLHRLPTHEEVADEALYLMSESAGAVTGGIRYVDGGRRYVQ